MKPGTPEPVFRCEVCGHWIPRDPTDEGLGPQCSVCAQQAWQERTPIPRMWPAARVKP